MLKNQSVGGALASVLCCCVPAFVGRCVGLEQERRLTEKEKNTSSGNSLWQVPLCSPLSVALSPKKCSKWSTLWGTVVSKHIQHCNVTQQRRSPILVDPKSIPVDARHLWSV